MALEAVAFAFDVSAVLSVARRTGAGRAGLRVCVSLSGALVRENSGADLRVRCRMYAADRAGASVAGWRAASARRMSGVKFFSEAVCALPTFIECVAATREASASVEIMTEMRMRTRITNPFGCVREGEHGPLRSEERRVGK